MHSIAAFIVFILLCPILIGIFRMCYSFMVSQLYVQCCVEQHEICQWCVLIAGIVTVLFFIITAVGLFRSRMRLSETFGFVVMMSAILSLFIVCLVADCVSHCDIVSYEFALVAELEAYTQLFLDATAAPDPMQYFMENYGGHDVSEELHNVVNKASAHKFRYLEREKAEALKMITKAGNAFDAAVRHNSK